MPARAEQLTGNKLGDAEKVMAQCGELEGELTMLQVAYEQFFLGMERKPPTREHQVFKKKVTELRTQVVRSVVVKVRVGNLATRLTTYERLWDRTLKEIESGTYRRDIYKARLHAKKQDEAKKKDAKKRDAKKNGDQAVDLDEDLDLSDLEEDLHTPPEGNPLPGPIEPRPEPAPAPPAAPAAPAVKPGPPPKPLITAPLATGASPALTAPSPANQSGPRPAAPSSANQSGPRPAAPSAANQSGPRPASNPSQPPIRPVATGSQPTLKPGAGADGLSEQKIKAIYDAYVMAKRRCGEDTSRVSLETVTESLKKQVPELMKQHKARSVEFKVVIKDGKAVLRALPKE